MTILDEALLSELEERIESLIPDPRYPDDAFVIITLREAIVATREGNFGVGAVLVHRDGEIIQRGHNRVLKPFFRSDMHAEMNVMTNFEERYRGAETRKEFILYSSLEPCPMCFTRMLVSGIGKIYYASPDKDGGMVGRANSMPPVWRRLALEREFGLASCSPELRDIAFRVFKATNRSEQSTPSRVLTSMRLATSKFMRHFRTPGLR